MTGDWVPFGEWLRRNQTGGAAAASQDEARQNEPGAGAAGSSPSQGPQPASQQQPQAPRGAGARRAGGAVQPLIPDCRAEEHRLQAYQHAAARQELSVCLAAPGLPTTHAPVLTAKHAAALLKSISEPLVTLEVGRLTRRLSSPTKLVPTEEQGSLSLWLLPDDSLLLTFASKLAAPQRQRGPEDGSDGGSSSSEEEEGGASNSGGGGAAEAAVPGGSGQQVACGLVVWEALVHFPESCFYHEAEEPAAVIHTLRNDPSGRSFYLRPRADIAAQTAEQAAEQLRLAGDGGGAASPPTPSAEAGAPRFYFWLRGRNTEEAVRGLGRLKGLLRLPPTLARRSGVSPKKLGEIGRWLASLEAAAAAQRATQGPSAATQDPTETAGGPASSCPSVPSSPTSGGSAATGSGAAPECHTPPPQQQLLPQGASGAAPGPPAAPTTPSLVPRVFSAGAGGTGLASARMAGALASVVQLSHTTLLAGLPGSSASLQGPQPARSGAAAAAAGAAGAAAPASSQQQQPSQQQAGGEEAGDIGGTAVAAAPSQGGAATLVTASSTVSASASAIFHDQRFNLLAPVAVVVVASAVLQAASPADQQQALLEGLQGEAVAAASALAQRRARTALEASGQRVMEEQLSEAVLGTLRVARKGSSRQRAHQAAAAQRERQAAAQRRWQTALAMPAIRAAAARAGQPPRSLASGSLAAVPSASSLSSLPPSNPATPRMSQEPPGTARAQCADTDSGSSSSSSSEASERSAFGSAGSLAAPPQQAEDAAAPSFAVPPPSRLRRRPAAAGPTAAAAADAGPSSGRVTLGNLGELLGGSLSAAAAAPEPPAVVGGGLEQQQEEVQTPTAVAGKGEGQGLAAEEAGGPGKVSLGALFKLLNGCLDM